jgi:sec-independent protein translocase protein TatB
MSFSETIFLFLLALLVFGPKKLPEIGRQIGKLLNEFRRASNEFKAQIESEISQLDMENHKILPPTAPPAGAMAALSIGPQPVSHELTAAPSTIDSATYEANRDSTKAGLPESTYAVKAPDA